MFQYNGMAGFMNKKSAKPEDFLYCMLCGQEVQEPQLLECNHVFCRRCWDDNVKLEAQVNYGRLNCQEEYSVEDIQCPTCVMLTPVANVRDAFPKSYGAKRLFEYVTLKSSGDDQRDMCRPCSERSQFKKAKKFCQRCDWEMCSSCGDKHAEEQRHRVDLLPPNFILKCKHHSHRMKDVCRTCRDTILCSSCKDLHQVEGDDPHECTAFEDYVAANRAKLTRDLYRLHQDIAQKEAMLTQLTDLWALQDKRKIRNEQNIDRHASFLIERIHQRCGELKEILLARHQERKDAMEKQKMYLRFHIQSSYRLKNLIQQVSRNGQEFALLANYKDIRVRCHQVGQKDIENTKAMEVVQTASNFDTKNDLTLGQITETALPKPQKNEMPEEGPSDLSGERDLELNPRLVCSFGESSSVCIKESKPKGITFMRNGHVALAYYDDKCIKIYSLNGKVTAIIKATNNKFFPNDVAFDGKDQLISTCGFQKLVKVFKVPSEEEFESVQTPVTFQHNFHEPFGLAIDTELQRIAVADMLRHNVTIFNMAGKKLKVFGQFGKNTQGLNCPEYLAIDQMHNIWVSDCKNHFIKAFDMDGNFLCKIGGQGSDQGLLNQPGSLAVDHWGNIIVADGGNHRVCIYSGQGKFIQVMLNAEDHEIFWPYGVALSTNGLVALTRRVDGRVAVFKAYTTKPDVIYKRD